MNPNTGEIRMFANDTEARRAGFTIKMRQEEAAILEAGGIPTPDQDRPFIPSPNTWCHLEAPPRETRQMRRHPLRREGGKL